MNKTKLLAREKAERLARNKVMKAKWLMHKAMTEEIEAAERYYLIKGTYLSYEDVIEYEEGALYDACRARDKAELAKTRYACAVTKLREVMRYRRTQY